MEKNTATTTGAAPASLKIRRLLEILATDETIALTRKIKLLNALSAKTAEMSSKG